MAKTQAPPASAKPFVKWAGGKRQLLGQLRDYLPKGFAEGQFPFYVEPFVGGGAVFFFLASKYPLERAWLSDVNKELVVVYRTVQEDVDALVERLGEYQKEYLKRNAEERENLFYQVREQYNAEHSGFDYQRPSRQWTARAAKLIFLNKTCFNGLFRQNRQGDFNVPFGRYKNPAILDEANLRRAAAALQMARIEARDFADIEADPDEKTFVYLDPPYRPLSTTASFTSYSKGGFAEADQERLARFYRKLDARGAKVMLSNSDPRNVDPSDDFFERHYEGFNIHRVHARRCINCIGNKRGEISELVITNYEIA